MFRLRWEDRLFLTGTTGSGKSELARRIFAAAPGRRIVIDPKDDPDATAAGIGYVVTFRDPNRLPDAATLRFVPRDPLDLELYDRLYGRLLASGPRFVWTDELGTVAPAAGTPKGVRTLIYQGRAKHIGHMGCHPRPVDLSRTILSQSQHIVAHRLPDPDDSDHIRRVTGLARDTWDPHMRALAEFGFCWWDVRAGRLVVVRRGLRLRR